MRDWLSASARITRQKRVQSITAIAMMTELRPVPSTATRRMANSTGGNAIQTSTMREMMRSAQPPK